MELFTTDPDTVDSPTDPERKQNLWIIKTALKHRLFDKKFSVHLYLYHLRFS